MSTAESAATSVATSAQFAQHVALSASCASALEDGKVAMGQRDVVLREEDLRDEWMKMTPPHFFASKLRPTPVAISTPNENSSLSRTSIYIPIWKSASTFVISRYLPLAYGRKSLIRGPKERLAHVSQRKIYLPGQTQPVASFSRGPHSAGADFTQALHDHQALLFTVVRDPLLRFISSAWDAHKGIPLCHRVGPPDNFTYVPDMGWPFRKGKTSTAPKGAILDPCPNVLLNMEAHTLNISGGSPRRWMQRIQFPHWISQTYFLSSTDAQGHLLRFNHVARAERLDEDLRSLSLELGLPEDRWEGLKQDLHEASVEETNSNRHGVTEAYAKALESTPAICAFCELYAQDYDCLDYKRPEACERNRCATVERPPTKCPYLMPGRGCEFIKYASGHYVEQRHRMSGRFSGDWEGDVRATADERRLGALRVREEKERWLATLPPPARA